MTQHPRIQCALSPGNDAVNRLLSSSCETRAGFGWTLRLSTVDDYSIETLTNAVYERQTGKSQTKLEDNVMFKAALTRKALQAICLSVWMCCLPALKAGIDCTECAEFCSSAGCCEMSCTSCGSGVSESLSSISVSRSNHGAVPPGEPCSCSCCVLGCDTVAAHNSSPRGRSAVPSIEHASSGTCDVAPADAPVTPCFEDHDRRCSVRSLERCIRLCRFRL